MVMISLICDTTLYRFLLIRRIKRRRIKAREVKRVQKTLEDTNLKLGDVVSDMMGKASRMFLHAIAYRERGNLF